MSYTQIMQVTYFIIVSGLLLGAFGSVQDHDVLNDKITKPG